MQLYGKTILVTGSTDGVGARVAERSSAPWAPACWCMAATADARREGAGGDPRGRQHEQPPLLPRRSRLAGRRAPPSPTRCAGTTSASTS